MSKPKKVITEYRHYDLPPDFPILVLHGERWYISDVKADRLHFHNCLEIGICHSHEGHLDFGEQSVPYKAGDFTLIARNYPHTTYSTHGGRSLWSYIFVDLDEFFKNHAFMSSAGPLVPSLSYYIGNKETSPKLYHYILSVIDEMTNKLSGYTTSVKGLMAAILIEITRLCEHAMPEPKVLNNSSMLTIHPALNYIHDNYMHQFPIEILAEMCHLSVTHFRRTFNTIMGTSPLDYINNTRIDHACLLLSGTDASILEISEQVGFHSVSSFNRAFVKVMNTS
ncbi:MAG: helix-turn-helix domain-containing protein, partial [Lachnospiraceae bacterium]